MLRRFYHRTTNAAASRPRIRAATTARPAAGSGRIAGASAIMRFTGITCIFTLFAVGCQARDAGVGPAPPTPAPSAEGARSRRPAPGPEGGAKIPPDARKIAEMLRDRFGAAAVRAVRVEVEDD